MASVDSFRNLTKEESEKKLNDWFFDLEYLEKMRILLRVYPNLNITKIEGQGIGILWRKVDLEKQKDIYQEAWKFQR